MVNSPPEKSGDPKTHTTGDACRRDKELNDYCGGRRLLRPSTHTQAKYHKPHRSGGFIRDNGNQERTLVDSPLGESAGQTTDDQTLLEGTSD